MMIRIHQSFCLLGIAIINMAQSLKVTPSELIERENHDESHFFCREDDNNFAQMIIWQDPHGNYYTPNSGENGDKISAEGSRLSIFNITRNDAGIYRCLKSNDHTEFADANLIVQAPPKILNPIPEQDIYKGKISIIKCEVDRGVPLADIYWNRFNYNNVTRKYIPIQITSSYDPRFRIVENGLEISSVQLSDEGRYRCSAYNFISAKLDIQAIFKASPRILNPIPVQDICNGTTSLIKCEVDRGIPLADIHWLHVKYNNETGEEKLLITSNYDPRFKIVEKGLEISNVQSSDEGTYRCYANNSVSTATLDVQAVFKAPPDPIFQHYNHTIELNEPITIHCSVSAVPHPGFQWILANTEEPLPASSWDSIYANHTTTSTLKYTFGRADLNEYCRIGVMCIATNPYGRSEQHFTLSLNSSESCYIIPSIVPSVTLRPSVASNWTLAIDDHGLSIESMKNTIVFPVVGAGVCFVLVLLVILAFAVCLIFFKIKKKTKDLDAIQMGGNRAYETIQCRSAPYNEYGKTKDLDAIQMGGNPAYETIHCRSDKTHQYEMVPL